MPEESLLSTLGLVGSGVLITLALGLWWRQAKAVTAGGLVLVTAIGLIHCVALMVTAFEAGLQPGGSAHDSILAMMLAYLIFHSGLTVLLTGMQILRVYRGYT